MAAQTGPIGSGAAKMLPSAGMRKWGGATTTAYRIARELSVGGTDVAAPRTEACRPFRSRATPVVDLLYRSLRDVLETYFRRIFPPEPRSDGWRVRGKMSRDLVGFRGES